MMMIIKDLRLIGAKALKTPISDDRDEDEKEAAEWQTETLYRAIAARLPKTDNLELARAICRVVASVQRHEVIFAAAAWTNLSAGRD